MPTSAHPAITTERMIDVLGRLAVTTAAYAVAVVLVALCILPTILTPLPVAALLPKPPPVVARSHVSAPAVEAAPAPAAPGESRN